MAKAENLHPTQPAAELRKHYFLDSYVVIAPKRSNRPSSFSPDPVPHKSPSSHCPFDNNTEHSVWQTPRGNDWRVKVVPNAYSAFSLNNPFAYGTQEVVINTPDHNLEFSELPVSDIMEIFTAYRQRLTVLSRLEGIRYVLVFKNDGPIAGASIAHAHCQIYALPLVPPKIARESDALTHYWESRQSCGYCDVIAWEETQKVRVIAEDKHFMAIAPYASSHALEAWILPRRHVNKFVQLHATELHSLAIILKKIAARLDANVISFNYFLQESLDNQDHHFVIKVEPRTTKYGGEELATGVEINPIAPEFAALWYNGKIP